MKESIDKNSSICSVNYECFTPMTILRTISTSTFQETTANAIINLQANDEDHTINEIKSVDFSTFLQDWEAFHNEFTHSTTYTLAEINYNYHSFNGKPRKYNDQHCFLYFDKLPLNFGLKSLQKLIGHIQIEGEQFVFSYRMASIMLSEINHM